MLQSFEKSEKATGASVPPHHFSAASRSSGLKFLLHCRLMQEAEHYALSRKEIIRAPPDRKATKLC